MKFEPSGDARQLAAALWGQYQALIEQGFTPAQSLALIQTMLTAGGKS